MLSINKTIPFLLIIIAPEYETLSFCISGLSAFDLVALAGFEGGIFGKGSNMMELSIKASLL